MSLINDMLRDLEQRRELDKQQTPVSSPAAVTRKPVHQRLTLMVGALVLVLLMLLVAGWTYYLPKEAATHANVTAPALDEALNLLPLESATAETVVVKAAPVPAANPLLTSVRLAEEAQSLQLELTFDSLPARAEIRSTPQEGRVVIRLPDMHLQQGLVIPQPQNESISNISLVPTSAGLDLIIATVAGLQIATSQHLESHSARLVIGFEFLAVTAAQGSAMNADKTESAFIALPSAIVAEPQSAPALTPAVTATLVRTQPAPQTDEQLYRRGLQQVRQGDLRAAQESFTGSLRINRELLAARLELIGVLQQQAEEQQAFQVIQEGLQLHPAQPELRKLVAHYLLYQQRHQEALTQLELPPVPAVAADPDYHALRAALYQELGEYPQAGLLYAQLLEQRPREPLWWMGLAIALDQQGLSGGARDAYRTALDVSGLRPDLEQFVRKRLQQL